MTKAPTARCTSELHDGKHALNLSKIGLGLFLGKVLAGVDCGGSSFVDVVRGYSGKAIAIEPLETFSASPAQRGYAIDYYATDAAANFKGKMGLLTSFSVIEHFDDPLTIMKFIRALLL